MFRNPLILVLPLVLSLGACRDDVAPPTADGTDTDGETSPPADEGSVDETGDSGEPADSGDPEPEPRQAPSARAAVKPKIPSAYARDLATALDLPVDELCRELSTYDCIDTHRIALGGVAPYEQAVFEALPEPGVSSPIAIDRIALTACGERVERDWADGSQELFAELQSGDDGEEARLAVADRLYRRILRRDGEPRELQAVVDLWDDLPDPDGRTWAQLGCFAIATTLENLFY